MTLGGYPPSYRVAKWGLSLLLTHLQLSHSNLPGLTHECWELVLRDITQLSYLPRLCHLRLLCDTSLLLSLPPWFFWAFSLLSLGSSFFILTFRSLLYGLTQKQPVVCHLTWESTAQLLIIPSPTFCYHWDTICVWCAVIESKMTFKKVM